MPFTFNIAPCPGWHLWWWISMYFCLLPFSLHPLSFHVLLPLGSILVLTSLSSPWFLLVNQADNFLHCQVDKQSLFLECRQLFHLGPIHFISDSSRTTFLTRSDLKLLHCSHYSAPLRSRHKAVCLEDLWLTLKNNADCSSKRASGATMYWIHAFTLGQKWPDIESNPIHTTSTAEWFHSQKRYGAYRIHPVKCGWGLGHRWSVFSWNRINFGVYIFLCFYI